jgi:hypothetical protein
LTGVGAAQAQEAQGIAFFREISGTVETRAADSQVWVSAVAGGRIEKNTLVSTGFKSSALIELGNSTITVRPLTRLSLEEIIKKEDGEQVNLYLQTGRVRADVNPPAGGKVDFTVRSPSVTASVRGTLFEFDTDNIRVYEGQVQYSSANGQSVLVAEGGTSRVDETNNTVVNPFIAAGELLVPALPAGGESGNSLGDTAPVTTPMGSPVGIDIGWD